MTFIEKEYLRPGQRIQAFILDKGIVKGIVEKIADDNVIVKTDNGEKKELHYSHIDY
jgi:hypothetical protein